MNPKQFFAELRRRNVLQSGDCLRDRRMAADAGREPDLSVSLNSMKTLLVRGHIELLMSILIVFSGVELAAGQNPPIHENLQSQLIGAWRLVWSEDQGADGKIHRIERTGILTFSHDGHMSVQIRVRDPGELPAATAKKYWQGGYAAYYGRYDVDEHAHTITFHVEGALVRTLIGTDLIRVYDFSGNQLVLKPLRPDEHWAFAWEHY